MSLTVGAWQPPAEAVRDAELEAWEVSVRDASGVRDGDCTLYRDDGSVLLSCHYEKGKRSGPFTSFHPNGEIESQGHYVEGALDGPYVRYTSDAPGSAPLRNCCVPRGARRLHARYVRGTFLGETFFDEAGRGLRSDGNPLPERAPGVPDEASFEEGDERWVLRLGSDDDTVLRRSFDLEGRLVEEIQIARGRRIALREYHASGGLAREVHFDDDGVLHGSCLSRHGDEDAPYTDRTIREVRGAYEHGQAVGTWEFFDAGGQARTSQDRGEALSDERLVELLGREESVPDAETLERRVEESLAVRRVREALFFAARAAARSGRAERLSELLAKTVVPLEPGARAALAALFDREQQPNVRVGFDALLGGAEPAEILRVLATLVPSARSTGRDLIEASLLLAPESPRSRVTRALIRLEQGDDAGALTDLSALGDEFGPAVTQIRELRRVLFPTFAFSPALEPPPEPDQELAPVAVEQTLDAVRTTIALYATRIAAVRREIRSRLDAEPAWLPPDPFHLLGAEPVELRRFDATITDEDEDGSETSEVSVDETLELRDASTATLMITARADWDALTWLCWSAGLDEVALPVALVPRPEFGAAINDVMQRCFRVHDQRNTGGLVSRARGVAGFRWEGLPVEELTSRLAEIAERQYVERRAMFFWLLFPQNLSPFQSDLRKV